jgi:hypothetical protein
MIGLMMSGKHIFAIILLFALGSSQAWSQSSNNRIASDLANLRQEQSQLEGNIDQYEKSIEVLRDNLPMGAGMDPTLGGLESELQQNRDKLKYLKAQEAALERKLEGGNTPVAATSSHQDESETAAVVGDNPDAAAVARLKTLLADYYASEAKALAGGDAAHLSNKVRLSGQEGADVIKSIDQYLSSNSLSSQRREPDIIFHIEVRRDGELASSSSHSLKSLGKSQYVAKVALQGGDAKVSVRKDSWVAELPSVAEKFYLITLSLSRSAEPELHVISVDELKSTHPTDLPVWLPYIGAIPAVPARS